MKFSHLQSKDAEQVAKLRIEGIGAGFINSLCIDFSASLYESIAQNKDSFGFVASENSRILD